MNKKELIVRGFIAPIITGLTVAICWHWINVIKAWNVHVYLPYANEYSYREIREVHRGIEVLPQIPIKIKLDEQNRCLLRLGISNNNIRSLKNITVHLNFPEGIKVVKYDYWKEWNPHKEYYTILSQTVNNGSPLSLEPLMLQIKKHKTYPIKFIVTGEDLARIEKKFLIEVVK